MSSILDSHWFRVTGLSEVVDQIRRTEHRIMAKLDEVLAQVSQANDQTNDIAGDISSLKQQLDAAIANAGANPDAEAQLQQVSDALQPLVARLQDVASQTTQ